MSTPEMGIAGLMVAGNLVGAHLTIRYVAQKERPGADPAERRRRLRKADTRLIVGLAPIVILWVVIGHTLVSGLALCAMSWAPLLLLDLLHGNAVAVGPIGKERLRTPSLPPAGRVAWDDSTTRAGVARYRRKGWAWLMADVAVLVVWAMVFSSTGANRSTTPPRGEPVIFAVVFLFLGAGLVSLWRARKSTRLLRSGPWHAVAVRWGNLGTTVVLELHPDGAQPVVLSPTMIAPWRLRHLRNHTATVWIVGDSTGPVLFTPDAGHSLFWASHGISERDKRRRAAVFTKE